MSIKLADSNSAVWLVSMNDSGQITVAPSSGGTSTLFLNDALGKSWQVTVTTLGVLQVSPVATSNYQITFQINSPLKQWYVGVSPGGVLNVYLIPIVSDMDLVAVY